MWDGLLPTAFCQKIRFCVYTFIPNREVTLIESDDEQYLAKRARISSIKDTWKPGVDYSPLIALAKEKQALPEKEERKAISNLSSTTTIPTISCPISKARQPENCLQRP